MDKVRSFIAIELPDTIKTMLATAQEAIRRELAQVPDGECALRSIKWVDPASIHLTLVFLGAVSADRAPLVEDGIRRVATQSQPFTLVIKDLGVFPSWTRPRVIWVGVEEHQTKRLGPLQDAIADEMAILGFKKEAREFSPHLTLARVRDIAMPEEKRMIGTVVRNTPRLSGESLAVTEVSLMRSDLSPRGALYAVSGLSTRGFPLKQRAPSSRMSVEEPNAKASAETQRPAAIASASSTASMGSSTTTMPVSASP